MDFTQTAGLKLTIANLAGASVSLLPSGAVVITSADGTMLVLGGASAGLPGVSSNCFLKLMSNATWDLNGKSLSFVNASDLRVGGKSIATVSAPDGRGDTLVSRGW